MNDKDEEKVWSSHCEGIKIPFVERFKSDLVDFQGCLTLTIINNAYRSNLTVLAFHLIMIRFSQPAIQIQLGSV